jgi:hypothetical protein
VQQSYKNNNDKYNDFLIAEDVNLHLTYMLTNMTMSEGLGKTLDIIADGTGRSLSKSISDTAVIERSSIRRSIQLS